MNNELHIPLAEVDAAQDLQVGVIPDVVCQPIGRDAGGHVAEDRRTSLSFVAASVAKDFRAMAKSSTAGPGMVAVADNCTPEELHWANERAIADLFLTGHLGAPVCIGGRTFAAGLPLIATEPIASVAAGEHLITMGYEAGVGLIVERHDSSRLTLLHADVAKVVPALVVRLPMLDCNTKAAVLCLAGPLETLEDCAKVARGLRELEITTPIWVFGWKAGGPELVEDRPMEDSERFARTTWHLPGGTPFGEASWQDLADHKIMALRTADQLSNVPALGRAFHAIEREREVVVGDALANSLLEREIEVLMGPETEERRKIMATRVRQAEQEIASAAQQISHVDKAMDWLLDIAAREIMATGCTSGWLNFLSGDGSADAKLQLLREVLRVRFDLGSHSLLRPLGERPNRPGAIAAQELARHRLGLPLDLGPTMDATPEIIADHWHTWLRVRH